MKITSKEKNLIAEYFDWTIDWNFLDIVFDAIEWIREDDEDITVSIFEAVDRAKTYTEDCWTILRYYFYSDIKNACFHEAMCMFENDIYELYAFIRASL